MWHHTGSERDSDIVEPRGFGSVPRQNPTVTQRCVRVCVWVRTTGHVQSKLHRQKRNQGDTKWMASFCFCSIKDRQMVQLNFKPAGYFGLFEMLLLYWDGGGQWSDKKNEMWLVYVSKYWTECNKYLTFLVHLNRVYSIWEYSILCYFMTRPAKVSYFCFHVLSLSCFLFYCCTHLPSRFRLSHLLPCPD